MSISSGNDWMLDGKYAEHKKRARNAYKDELKQIRFWDKVEKSFRKQSGKHRCFSMSFRHPDFDNEMKIEGIARLYGFRIVGEQLYPQSSVYYFEREY